MPTGTCSCPHTPECMCPSSSQAIFEEKRKPQAPTHMYAASHKKTSNPHGCLCTHVHLSTCQSLPGFWYSLHGAFVGSKTQTLKTCLLLATLGQSDSSQANRFAHSLKSTHKQRFVPTLPTYPPPIASKLPLPT